jgi:hypothetical protein
MGYSEFTNILQYKLYQIVKIGKNFFCKLVGVCRSYKLYMGRN